jgi:hypothetical protein
MVAEDIKSQPNWPTDKSLRDLLRLGFADKIIASPEHPCVILRGCGDLPSSFDRFRKIWHVDFEFRPDAVFNVAAMLLVLELVTLRARHRRRLAPAASPPTTMKRPTAGRGFSSLCSARSMALRVALSLPGIASRQARCQSAR